MKKAFTLAEILICMAIIGALGVVLMRSISNQNFDEKEYALKAHKAMRLIDEASAQIIQSEVEQVPAGAFMINTAGSWEYVICSAANSCTNKATSQKLIDLYKKYIKFESTTSNFKSNYTGYSSAPTSIYGAKIPGEIYIGMEVNSNNSITACPSTVYIPASELKTNETFVASTTANTSDKKCWGKIYIDTNGKKGPNELGKDVYVFGMGEFGIVK